MIHTQTDIRTNLLAWLKDQARLSFIFDASSRLYHVDDTLVVTRHRVFSKLSSAILDILKQAQCGDIGTSNKLSSCLMHGKWNDLLSSGQGEMIDRIDGMLQCFGYDDFQFLDSGARAFAFRTLHRPSGERRILRIEAPHTYRSSRPKHHTVAQAYQTLEGDLFAGMKIEISDEFVPLNKIPDAKRIFFSSSAKSCYHDLVGLARATNMTYAETLFDRDAELQNVGITPSGKILTFDPQFVRGDKAIHSHRDFKDPNFLKDASFTQLRLVYGCSPSSFHYRSPK